MRISCLMLAVTTVMLTACSSGPSNSEIKQVIENKFGKPCNRLDLDDFEKINGIAQGETQYEVTYTYTLVVKPRADGDPAHANWDYFYAACPNVDYAMRSSLQQGLNQVMQSNPDAKPLLDGFTLQMSGDITMVKTDNGWQAGI